MQTDTGYERAQIFLRAFQQTKGISAKFNLLRIATSNTAPEQRQVFRLTAPGFDYALKFDLTPDGPQAITADFAALSDLTTLAIRPVYCDPQHRFFVTAHYDWPSANQIARDQKRPTPQPTLFHRAGQWLHTLHNTQPATPAPFWPKRHLENLKPLIQALPASPLKTVARHRIETLRAEAAPLRGLTSSKTRAHGDFNGGNLLIGPDRVLGLDFSLTCERLAVFDVVDFLTDLDPRFDLPLDQVGPSGIIENHLSAFCDIYDPNLDPRLLSFLIKQRLLAHWLALAARPAPLSLTRQRKFDRVSARLEVAFADQ
ncbi:phosphotransferase [Cochlodiniinecator piscidefendens]|uniref:phosphotransferase n=1 Tax=Cochlodiniinecator piscidefendens TaxID=2715756 RepID=UPI00140BC356|nr:phosphotransferase [Cochlodiniinecator piscidefendens]